MGDQVSRLRTVSESSGFSRKRLVFGLKVAVFIVSLWPVTEIVIAFLTGNTRLFGANPAEKILHRTGDWAIYFLLITLAISPLRRITGLNDLIKFRRMAGPISRLTASFISTRFSRISLKGPLFLSGSLRSFCSFRLRLRRREAGSNA
jgi:preprotein translocase subunit SecG